MKSASVIRDPAQRRLAEDMLNDLANNKSWAPKICAVYDSTGGKTIPDAGGTITVPMDEQVMVDDDFYIHSRTVNPSRVTVKNQGLYRVYYSLWWNNKSAAMGAPSNQAVRAYVLKNGDTYLPSESTQWTTSNYNNVSQSALTIITMNQGDYIELGCNQSGGGKDSQTIANRSWLVIERIREV